ncbi:MAG: Gfo/Idh/MocA family oxidoreductase [Spirochaetes bacterium]|nr:Gfo/Idh/MocA family oxidoreductase [Spirochaetota bacterium]
MDKVKWGIIGCGDVTEVKSGPAFNAVNDSELVAVMRRNAAAAADYAARHGVPRWYADAQRLIDDPEVNAVYVATPPGSHAEYAIRAIEAGKPVYVEKPMARNAGECEAMLNASAKYCVPVYVAYYRRMLPSFLKIRELLENGAIGTPYLIRTALHFPPRQGDHNHGNPPWRLQPEISGGGYFVDLAAHTLDYLIYLMGRPVRASSITANRGGLYEVEDTLAATILFENGVLCGGTWCFATPHEAICDHTEIIGERGSVSFSTFDNANVVLSASGGKEVFHFSHPATIQMPLIRTVVEAILGRGDCPSTGITGIETSRLMDMILDPRNRT